ncbi:MAG: radical SAM protein [Calditrichaeota bacterium]|nr:radical SAM protein [Calditrichota bacterium]MCB9088222.1 radical SAM protein [Calditrichia bacterium]
MFAFGPINSRRLGQSLGINNIPPKHCSYACTYCQVGHTDRMKITRQPFFEPEAIVTDVAQRIEQILHQGGTIDFLSFVPDGEPTLDLHLGREIELLKPLGYPIAVFTNASLIWKADVREVLCKADWVSLKVDAVDEHIWHKINRPHGHLRQNEILEGMLSFADMFSGTLVTETMLVQGLNDTERNFKNIARFLKRLQPDIAYLAIPLRPTAEANIHPPQEMTVNQAYQIFHAVLPRVECLITPDDDKIGYSGDVEADILRTTAVHPLTEAAIARLLERSHAKWDTIHKLIAQGDLREIIRGRERFYIRCFPRETSSEKKAGQHTTTRH